MTQKNTLAIFLFCSLLIPALVRADTVTRFRAELSEDFVILAGVQGTGSSASGVADFVLTQVDNGPTTMSYHIQFENVDLDGLQTPDPLDNITALHIHDTTRCAASFPQCVQPGDTAGTVHLLNIFGLPRLDDDDVESDAVAGTIRGLWDDTDATPGLVAPSLPISDPLVLERLFNEEVAIFVHTAEIPSAASGGLLRIVPEPTTGWSLFIALVCWIRNARCRSSRK